MAGGKGIIIRQATDSDWLDIGKLAYSLFESPNLTNTEKDIFFIAALHTGGLVGFSHVRLLSSSIILRGIGIKKEYRRLGLGKRLINYSVAWCEKEFPGLPVKLKVKSANTPALSLYMKEGFMVSKDEGGAYKLVKTKPN